MQEVEAEAVSCIVALAIGLDVNAAPSDYILMYEGKADVLEASLDAIRRAAAAILAGLMLDLSPPLRTAHIFRTRLLDLVSRSRIFAA